MVAVADDERERRPERQPVPEPGEDLDLVLLELLPRAAAVALLAPREIAVDRGPVEPEPGGETGDDRDERGPVRLACGREPERHAGKPTAARMTSTGAGTPRPELERRGALRDEHLEPGDDARARPRARPSRRGLRVRKVDQRLARAELDENLVAHGGRVDDEVGVARVGRPVSAAREACARAAAPGGTPSPRLRLRSRPGAPP